MTEKTSNLPRPSGHELVTPERSVPVNHHDVPDEVHGRFWVMAQARTDYVLHAIPIKTEEHGTMMTIMATEEAVYITKAQAKAFFDLREVVRIDPAVADIATPKAQEGVWTLVAPDGRTWTGSSPLNVCATESRERIPPEVAYARIMRNDE